jgi:GAF domain-containing protein/HAMP domain-containing protein
MTSLLARPAALLRRLSYWQKFILMSGLFALPLFVLLLVLINEQTARIENYGVEEKRGAEYLQPVADIFDAVQRHRRLTRLFLNGDESLRQNLLDTQTQIDESFSAVEQLDRRYGRRLETTAALNALRQKWEDIQARTFSADVSTSEAFHAQLLADLRALITQVGNASYLILDPDLDSYYVMDLVVLKLPEQHDLLSEALYLSEGIVARGDITPDERAELLSLVSLARRTQQALFSSVYTAIDNNPSGTLQPLLDAPFQDHQARVNGFLDLLESRLINVSEIDVPTTELVSSGTAAIESSFAFYDLASSGLIAALQARIDRQTVEQIIVVSIAVLGTLVAFSVGFSILRAISRPLSQLTGAAQRLAAGNLEARVTIPGADEVARLGQAFNDMAGRVQTAQRSLETRGAQLQASMNVGRAAASILDPDRLLREIVNLIAERFGFYYVAVFTLDDAGKFAVLREATGEAGRALKGRGHKLGVGGESMVGYATGRRQPRIALDVGKERTRFANPLLPDTRSEIALPLVVGERLLGALDVQSTQVAAFDESSIAVLQSMADQIAVALNNAVSYVEAQAAARQARALYHASQEIGQLESDLNETVGGVMRAVADTLGYDQWWVVLFDDSREWLTPLASTRSDTGRPVRASEQPHSPAIRSAVHGETYIVNEPDNDPRLNDIPAARRAGIGRFVSVPIMSRDASIGAVTFGRPLSEPELSEFDLEVGLSMSSLITIAIENRRLYGQTRRALAEVDAVNRRLTGEAWQSYLSVADELRVTSGHLEEGGARARARAPIVIRGETIGVLDLESSDASRQWTAEDVALLNTIASEVALAVENARLIEQTQRAAQREKSIAEVADRIHRPIDLESILRVAVAEISQLTGAEEVSIRMGRPGRESEGNGHAG